MKNILLTLVAVFVFQILSFGQQNETTMTNLEIPKTNAKDQIISHTGYSLLYYEDHEQDSRLRMY